MLIPLQFASADDLVIMDSIISFVLLIILLSQATIFRTQAVMMRGHENTVAAVLTNNVDYNNSKAHYGVSALYVFGDSTVDAGNNDYLFTSFKSNFPPYGRDFIDQKPTGRFSNGKLATDFAVQALGLKETLPPYLDPNLHVKDFITGVTFASAGTGYDNLTATTFSVMPLWKQLDNFNEYRGRLQELVGKENASKIIREAIFVCSMGTNDLVNNYFLLPIRQKQFTVDQYQDFLLQTGRNFVEKLYGLGMRRLGILGVPPIGCLPLVKAERQFTIKGLTINECVENLNQVANTFNGKLQATVASLKLHLPKLAVVYVDIYDVLLHVVQNPAKYGFDVSWKGCCGTGLIETGPLCNAKTPLTCSDASKYVFWDSIHPSQKTYEIIARLVVKRDLPKLFRPDRT